MKEYSTSPNSSQNPQRLMLAKMLCHRRTIKLFLYGFTILLYKALSRFDWYIINITFIFIPGFTSRFNIEQSVKLYASRIIMKNIQIFQYFSILLYIIIISIQTSTHAIAFFSGLIHCFCIVFRFYIFTTCFIIFHFSESF